MSETKVRLSEAALALAGNAGVILTKNEVIEKTKILFGSLHQQQKAFISGYPGLLNGLWKGSSPKISRGENLKGLPYVLLDFPRVFEKYNTAAIRTMFWWGNFFSVTLHLSGDFKISLTPALLKGYEHFKIQGFFCCVNDGEWEHDFERSNYISLNEIAFEDFEILIQKRSFVKLAFRFPVEYWNEAEEKLFERFRVITEAVAGQAPSR